MTIGLDRARMCRAFGRIVGGDQPRGAGADIGESLGALPIFHETTRRAEGFPAEERRRVDGVAANRQNRLGEPILISAGSTIMCAPRLRSSKELRRLRRPRPALPIS